MSKSRGNFVDPSRIIESYGSSALRFFVLREIPFGQDGDFSEDSLIRRINSDLANDYGNLLYRTVNMVEKYNRGIIPSPGEREEADEELIAKALNVLPRVRKCLDNLSFNQALETIWEFVRAVNKYIDFTSPWKLKKENRIARLEGVLYNFLESLRFISLLTAPFIPDAAASLWRQLGQDKSVFLEKNSSLSQWGLLPGGRSVKKEAPLFPRIEK